MDTPLTTSSQYAPTFVEARAIAKIYSVTSRYILLLASEGKIPCLRLGKKCVRFCPDAVAAAIADATETSATTIEK